MGSQWKQSTAETKCGKWISKSGVEKSKRVMNGKSQDDERFDVIFYFKGATHP